MSTEKVKCACCGRLKPLNTFGDGMRIPKTTCLVCYGLDILAREAEKKKKEKSE